MNIKIFFRKKLQRQASLKISVNFLQLRIFFSFFIKSVTERKKSQEKKELNVINLCIYKLNECSFIFM